MTTDFKETIRLLKSLNPGGTIHINGHKIERQENGRYNEYVYGGAYWPYGYGPVTIARSIAVPKPPKWEVDHEQRKEYFFKYGNKPESPRYGYRWAKHKYRKGRWGRHPFRTKKSERQKVKQEIHP